MNMLVLSMLVSAGLCGMIASRTDRRPVFWLAAGLVAGPVAVAILLLLPSRAARSAAPSPIPSRSIVGEINGLEEMRQRGLIDDDEFRQGKARILAGPPPVAIPPAYRPHPISTDGRGSWAAYQSATRSALADLAHRHGIELRWRNDVPLEITATFPVQPGLSFAFSIGLEKGTIHCWSEDWDLGVVDGFAADQGLPGNLVRGLDALIEGRGRLVIRTALSSLSPFCVSLIIPVEDGFRTVQRRCAIPIPPAWRTRIVTNEAARSR